MSQTYLLLVPAEVLLQITATLTTPEYGCLRLTCKHIEASLFSAFSREFFTKRQFMVTEFSLQALVDISSSRLSKCLKTVILGIQRPPNPREGRGWHGVFENRNRPLEEYISHMSLINTGHDLEMLSQAFSNLHNLESVGLRDFYSQSRYRDYPNHQWKSYGASTYEEQTNLDLHVERSFYTHDGLDQYSEYLNYTTRCFLNLWRALSRSKSPPKNFEVILRRSALNDYSFHIPAYVAPSILPVLANIKILFLQLNYREPCPSIYVGTGSESGSEDPSYFLQRFLSEMPLLEHLRLNCRDGDERMVHILTWLAALPKPTSALAGTQSSLACFPQAPPPVNFSKLRELDFGMFQIDYEILLPAIAKFQATLRTLSFHRMGLDAESLSRLPGTTNLWAHFLREISKLNLELTALNLSDIYQFKTNERSRHITFQSSTELRMKSWAGQDTKKGLKGLIDQMMLDIPPHVIGSGNSDSDEFLEDSDHDSDDISEDDDLLPP